MRPKTEARDLLLALISPKNAELTRTKPEDAVAAAIHEAFLNQPSLRNCIYPPCLREFDMTARMNGWEPARIEWSGEGWHQVTRGPSTGSLCPDHVDIVTAHLPRTVDLPNGRWMVACACEWMSRPQTYGGLLKPLWEEHLLLAAGELEAPVTLTEASERIPLAEHTEETLKDLYDALDDTDYDRAETREAAQAMYKSWDWHRRQLGGVSQAVTAVCNQMRTDSRDWAAARGDAYLWGVLIGWSDDALEEIAVKHRWNEHRVKYVREMRALLATITNPPTTEDQQQ
ncbi:hypothetical protein [Streptomyces griseorubiginosus]|uniref:hypothetical protein n=1 Tax=Streptomyces griseorubiginosus TaxID=67304 RepID=UPI0033DB25B1